MSSLIPLTGAQKNALHALAENPAVAPSFAATGQANPKQRVFVVHFDGTENDLHQVGPNERATLVAESHKLIAGNQTGALQSRYYQGVGTSKGAFSNKVEAMLGIGCSDNAEEAYRDLIAQTRDWLKDDPECQVHVHVVGFSRGSATALYFMNLVDRFGVAEVSSPAVRPGEVKTSAVLFDTVSTGVRDLSLSLPNSNVATLHLTAGGEERAFFKLTPLEDGRRPSELALAKNVYMEGTTPGADGLVRYQRLQTLDLPGARHSDVGGSYLSGGIRELSCYLSREFQRTLGLPVFGVKPDMAMIQQMQANDSRWVKFGRSVERRQAATREEISVNQAVAWDGNYTESCRCVSGTDATSVVSHAVRPVRSVPAHLPKGFEGQLGRPLRFDWVVRRGSDGKDVVDFRTNANAKVAFDDGVLMVGGIAIQGAPTRNDIARELKRTGQVSLDVQLERGLPVFDARQAPGSRPVRSATPSREMWPKRFREAILELNARGREMGSRDIEQLMFECLEAASKELRFNFNEVSTVKFDAPSAGSDDLKFGVLCLRGRDRKFGHDSVSGDRVEYAMSVYMHHLREGLECVARAVRSEFGNFDFAGHHVFGRAVNPEMVDSESPWVPPTVESPMLRPSLLQGAGAGPAPFMGKDDVIKNDEAPAPRRLRLVR